MKPFIAVLAAAFLLASPGIAAAQATPPAKMEKQKKGPSDRAAVDCKKAENANNQQCMKAAKDQAASQKTKKNAPKTN